MKKGILATMILATALVLGACSSETDGGSKKSSDAKTSETAKSAEKKSDEFKKVGESGTAGKVTYTLKSITKTDERNEFEETQPANVIKIEYTVKNDSDEEIPAGMDLEVYDPDGKKLESYANDNTMDSVAAGKSIDAVQHFGTDKLGDFELQFSPLADFSGDVLKFKATVN